jgi:hypothetical protein
LLAALSCSWNAWTPCGAAMRRRAAQQTYSASHATQPYAPAPSSHPCAYCTGSGLDCTVLGSLGLYSLVLHWLGLGGHRSCPPPQSARAAITAAVSRYGARALRVLALAFKPLPPGTRTVGPRMWERAIHRCVCLRACQHVCVSACQRGHTRAARIQHRESRSRSITRVSVHACV